MNLKHLVIIGAGTLGKLIADIASDNGEYHVLGFVDDTLPPHSRIGDVEVLGSMAYLEQVVGTTLSIGIGSPVVRKRLMELLQHTHPMDSIIHRTAWISKNAKIGKGCFIGPGCIVGPESIIGNGTCILSGTIVNQKVEIGDYSLIGAGANLGNYVKVGTGAHIGLGKVVPLDGVVAEWSDF
jgi:acetyltransferase EpsM